jgi:hypothetical protein
MDYRRRRFALVLAVVAMTAATANRPSFGIHVDTESAAPVAPHWQGAVKLGLAGASVLVTWGAEQLR